MFSSRAVIPVFEQKGVRTLPKCFRSFHKTCRRQNLPKSWLSEASNVVYKKSETFLRNSYKKVGGLVQAFDDLLGISEVQEAQSSVKKAENDFMRTRSQVQAAKTALESVQERLREVRRKLDRVPRDDERYLALATEEHRILVEEKKMKSDYESLEALERDRFALLSGAVRDSHERERARAERTKHWSVIGSVGGAALGILGSTVVNYIRLKQIKNSIKETGNILIEKSDELTDLVRAQDDQMGTKTAELRESLSTQNKLLEQKLEELGSILNFVTLNLASDPLKDFGIQIHPPVGTKSFPSELSSGTSQNQGDLRDLINNIMLRIDSVIEVMKMNQQRLQGDFKMLQINLEKIDSSVLQNKERIVEELNKFAKFTSNQTVPTSGIQEAVTNSYLENNQWWTKASTLTSAICTVVTATVLVYELLK